jgi:hypothetical protein
MRADAFEGGVLMACDVSRRSWVLVAVAKRAARCDVDVHDAIDVA